MPPKRRTLRHVSKRLDEHDRKKRITAKGHFLAAMEGEHTEHWSDDFGRTLKHYGALHEALLKYGKKLHGKRLLHLGASSGIYTKFLQDQGMESVALDYKRRAVEIARKLKNKRVVQGGRRAREKGGVDAPTLAISEQRIRFCHQRPFSAQQLYKN